MHKESPPYQQLCTQYYELDKPQAPQDALQCYFRYAEQAQGPLLEPMCGTGRFLIPLLEKGYHITGFDNSHHMLDVCRKKCEKQNLSCTLQHGNFENFSSEQTYPLIFIPSGSFCLLTTQQQITAALNMITTYLSSNGKFVFEIETPRAISQPEGIWKSDWVDKADGSRIVINRFSKFDPFSRIETTLCRYELWQNNTISQVEVEDFRLKLYEIDEIENLLIRHGLTVTKKYPAEPYIEQEVTENSAAILYECIKN